MRTRLAEQFGLGLHIEAHEKMPNPQPWIIICLSNNLTVLRRTFLS